MVLLEDSSGRILPVFIDENQATSISSGLDGRRPTILGTHDFIMATLRELEVEIKKATIYALRGNRFFARLTLAVDGKETDVDGRPSDAIAVAVRAEAPIFVSESVMDKASVDKSDISTMIGPDYEPGA